MSVSLMKHLQQLEQIQNQIDNLYKPLNSFEFSSQNWINELDKNMGLDWVQDIQKQVDSINQNIEPFNNAISEQMTTIDRAFGPVIDPLNNQQLFTDRLNAIDFPSFTNIQKWHHNIDYLVNSRLANLTDLVPESFYNSLNDLTLELENSNYLSEDNQDILTENTVRKPSVVQVKEITWAELIVLILTIWQVIFMFYSDYASSVQREEQISELKIQNELTKKQIEIDEKKLINAEQLLELELEKYEHQKRLEEKFNAFIESIEPFIPDQVHLDGDD